MDLDLYMREIEAYKQAAAEITTLDNPAALQEKIELLVMAMKLIGEVAAEWARQYRRMHVLRKRRYAEAYKVARAPKALNADLEVSDLEELEAEAYAEMHKYRNAFDSTQEEIHALKQRMRVYFADMSVGSRYER